MEMNSRLGFSHGSVMLTNRRNGPAPSSIAALCSDTGMDCSPASSISAVSGA